MRDHRGKADRNDVASYAQTGQDDDSRARAGVGGAFRFVKASELCCTSLLPRKGSDGGSPLPTTVESGGVPTIPLIPEPNQEIMLTSNSPSWTTKALAKNRTERESTKKAKTAASVEVNSPRVGSKARETDLSLQSSNLWSLLVALLDILPATESGGRREG